MNNTLKNTITALLALSAHWANGAIEIDVKLIDAPENIVITTDLTALDRTKGVDLVSLPKVTVECGREATLEIKNDFPVEGQEPIPVGIELEIMAEESADGLTFVARYRLTEFEGYLDEDTKHRPVFKTILIPFSGSAQSHTPLLIEIGDGAGGSTKRYIYLTLKKVR